MALKINGTALSEKGQCFFNGSEVRKIIYNGVEVWKRCYALIPTMTSNTAPEGTAYCSSKYNSNCDAYKAFDDDASTNWACQSGRTASTITSDYLGYIFPDGKTVHIDYLGFVGLGTNATYHNVYDTTIYIQFYDASGAQITNIEYAWSASDAFNEVQIPCNLDGVHHFTIWFSNRMDDGSSTSSHYVNCAKLQAYGHEE